MPVLLSDDQLEIINYVAGLDSEALRRANEDYHFNEVHSEIQYIIELAKFLNGNTEGLTFYNEQELRVIIKQFTRLLEFSNQILDVDPRSLGEQNPNQVQSQIIDGIKDCYTNLTGDTLIKFEILKLKEMSSPEEIQSLLTKANQVLANISNVEESASSILLNLNTASAETGFGLEANYFADASKSNYDTSKWWLISSIILAAIIVGLLFVHPQVFPSTEFFEDAPLIQFLAFVFSRLLPISIGIFFLVQTLRSYFASMHLAKLNKHRENCLRKFRTFSDASNDAQVKDAILTQAVRSIFEPGKSGYINDENSAGHGFDMTRVVSNTAQTLDG